MEYSDGALDGETVIDSLWNVLPGDELYLQLGEEASSVEVPNEAASSPSAFTVKSTSKTVIEGLQVARIELSWDGSDNRTIMVEAEANPSRDHARVRTQMENIGENEVTRPLGGVLEIEILS